MKGKPSCPGGFGVLMILAAVVSALALLLVPTMASGAPRNLSPPTPTPESGSRVESPFQSQIVSPSGATPGGAQAGFRPQGAQVAGQFDFTPWVLVCCFVLVVLAVIWVILFWLLGRRGKARPAPQPPRAQPVPPPARPPVAPSRPAEPVAPLQPVQETAPTEPQAVPSGVSLTMQKGPQPGWQYVIAKSPISIGGASESDMVISDPQVSPQHAMIWQEGGNYHIQDVGSTYGTYVNGERLAQARPLKDGDEIGLGPGVVLVFQSTG